MRRWVQPQRGWRWGTNSLILPKLFDARRHLASDHFVPIHKHVTAVTGDGFGDVFLPEQFLDVDQRTVEIGCELEYCIG